MPCRRLQGLLLWQQGVLFPTNFQRITTSMWLEAGEVVPVQEVRLHTGGLRVLHLYLFSTPPSLSLRGQC